MELIKCKQTLWSSQPNDIACLLNCEHSKQNPQHKFAVTIGYSESKKKLRCMCVQPHPKIVVGKFSNHTFSQPSAITAKWIAQNETILVVKIHKHNFRMGMWSWRLHCTCVQLHPKIVVIVEHCKLNCSKWNNFSGDTSKTETCTRPASDV